YLGRLDNQIKLRGFRIELGEIETVLRSNDQIPEAAVVLRQDSNDGQMLVGYLVVQGGLLDAPALRGFLRERLPEYMIPAAFGAMEWMPKTTSGKLDRKAFPAPSPEPHSRRVFVPPADEIEERLTNIWEEMLGVHPISITDNYFDLGGHSLLALQLFSQ